MGMLSDRLMNRRRGLAIQVYQTISNHGTIITKEPTEEGGIPIPENPPLKFDPSNDMLITYLLKLTDGNLDLIQETVVSKHSPEGDKATWDVVDGTGPSPITFEPKLVKEDYCVTDEFERWFQQSVYSSPMAYTNQLEMDAVRFAMEEAWNQALAHETFLEKQEQETTAQMVLDGIKQAIKFRDSDDGLLIDINSGIDHDVLRLLCRQDLLQFLLGSKGKYSFTKKFMATYMKEDPNGIVQVKDGGFSFIELQ